MKLTLKRIALRPTYTIGKLYIDGEYFCDTCEDKVRDTNKNGVFDEGKKVYGETAIPYGTYKVILSMSNRFKRVLPLLLDVPEFSGIRIHSGNTAEKDSAGCILVGENKQVGKVLNSRRTENKLMQILNATDEDIEIEIV
jgi:hypothetical protein